jgi:hypothetical protein
MPNTVVTIRTYDVYYQTKHNAVKKDEIQGRNAWAARCQVEEHNPDCTVTRVLLQSNSDW